jgi:hypothetical protein
VDGGRNEIDTRRDKCIRKKNVDTVGPNNLQNIG